MFVRILGVALALSVSGSLGAAQTPPPAQTPPAAQPAPVTPTDSGIVNALALFRSDLRTQKSQVLAKALALPEAEAKIFWPLHRQYEVEMSKLWDERVTIIRDYATQHATLTDAGAIAIAERVFAWEEKRLKLNRDQLAIFSKQLPGKTVVHFFQLDGYLNRVIEVQLASAMPEVRQVTK